MDKKIKNLLSTKAQKKKMQQTVSPMLATLTEEHFYEDGWLYEIKFDGERCVAFKNGKTVTLRSRNHKSLDVSYPEIRKGLAKMDLDRAIFDGEVVALERGVSNFSLLQQRMHASIEEIKKSHIKVYYYIFDVLYIDGYDVTKLPLVERKRILDALSYKDPIRISTYRYKATALYYKKVCAKGQEGLIVKKADSIYVHKRSSDWLKFKCINVQELVIGGYTDPKGTRTGFGALLIGYYKNGTLHYAGKVGTGFDQKTLTMLMKKFKTIVSKKNPFINYDGAKSGVHWLKPTLVAEFVFGEWTKDNKLRHSRYVGLRRDKRAQDVRQEK